MADFTLPTEIIDLPSQGKIYSSDSPLSEGKVEMKYMTAKEEDILTNQSYIRDGVVIDKLLQLRMTQDVNIDDITIGDKNAIMVASRILGYGKDYKFTYLGEDEVIDLQAINPTPLSEEYISAEKNEFAYTLPSSGNTVTFKILTHGDEKKIEQELKGLSKLNKNSSPVVTTRLKHLILSINGEDEKAKIREFVDNYLLAQDSRALREYIKGISPDIDLTFFPEGSDRRVDIPIGVNFFWPDA